MSHKSFNPPNDIDMLELFEKRNFPNGSTWHLLKEDGEEGIDKKRVDTKRVYYAYTLFLVIQSNPFQCNNFIRIAILCLVYNAVCA